MYLFCIKKNYELYKSYLNFFKNRNKNIWSCLIYKDKQNDEIKTKFTGKNIYLHY